MQLATAGPSLAAEPPNQHDPCSSGGRDTCGTLGVGFYKNYRYGIRWFGDFRGAIAGEAPSFCLDLGFWYASSAYRYRARREGRLRNRDGEAVPVERQERMAYAIWRFGRSQKPNQQAAVALYVHSLMGDARPGEVDPAALKPRVVSVYEEIVRAVSRYHGPYRLEAMFSGALVVGRPGSVNIRVLSAEGNALPNVPLTLSAPGASGLAGNARTNGDGVASVRLTPTEAGRLHLSVEAGPLASTLPRIFRAVTTPAAANAQRLATASSQRVKASVNALVRAKPTLSTVASAGIVRAGASIFDRIRVRGLGRTAAAIDIQLFGPFATRSAVGCRGRPYWTGTVAANADGEITSPSVRVRAGFYTYRERLSRSPLVAETMTKCPLAIETSLAAPKIITGRGDAPRYVPAPDVGAPTPTRVRLPSVGIDAAVLPVAIDLRSGALGVPANISRVGWWKDGIAPGARAGAILIAGHVDSAKAGVGAFFSLHRAKPHERVQVRTAGGRTFTYRVVSVRYYRKQALPTRIYSRNGPPRLVLVTCGGPFDRAAGRYRENVVLTATPTHQ